MTDANIHSDSAPEAVRPLREELATLMGIAAPSDAQRRRKAELIELIPRLCRHYDDISRPNRKRRRR